MYGWRARIGLIVPHSNTTMEPEFYRLIPEGVSVHTARLRISGATVEGLSKLGSDGDIARVASELADLDAAVIAFACTSASFVGSVDADLIQAREIEKLVGRPAIPAATAVVEALRALGAVRIAIGTPYPDDVNTNVERFLTAKGFEVLRLCGVDHGGTRRSHNPLADTPVSHVGLLPPEVAYKLGRRAFVEGADAIFLSAANIRTLDIIAPLEVDLGVPVVTSSQAIVWAALQLAGVREPIHGYGRLLGGQVPLDYGMRV